MSIEGQGHFLTYGSLKGHFKMAAMGSRWPPWLEKNWGGGGGVDLNIISPFFDTKCFTEF